MHDLVYIILLYFWSLQSIVSSVHLNCSLFSIYRDVQKPLGNCCLSLHFCVGNKSVVQYYYPTIENLCNYQSWFIHCLALAHPASSFIKTFVEHLNEIFAILIELPLLGCQRSFIWPVLHIFLAMGFFELMLFPSNVPDKKNNCHHYLWVREITQKCDTVAWMQKIVKVLKCVCMRACVHVFMRVRVLFPFFSFHKKITRGKTSCYFL